VDALLIGTGGLRGWPEPGCTCASCLRAAANGPGRLPGQVLIDGTLLLAPGEPPQLTQHARAAQAGSAGYQVREVPGGWDITGPDGGRLLAAASPGSVPEPEDGPGLGATAPFDIALLDLLASPAQLGLLRARGLVHDNTAVAAIYADHRVTSQPELARRCALWGAAVGTDGMLIAGQQPESARPAAARPDLARPRRTLIIGGARSGKSREAELRLAGEPSVTYLAAGPWADPATADTEWAGRVAAHRAGRPPWWRTEESLDVASALRRDTGALLIDGIGTWLAAVMDTTGLWTDPPAPGAAGRLAVRVEELISAWRQTRGLVVAVTDQVGEGLVPAYAAGRAFRDQLGWLNQRLAAESDLVLHVVAGRVAALPA
jgi:adenosylcobinamide kinase / adenosylcobinamide-phosphate guanylyltransferase